MKEYFGKYRAFVTDNRDPENQGRIKVQVPYISGNGTIGWCLPCVPVAYTKGGDLNIPKVGSFVWVEFEHGDIRYPIYTGGIYGSNNLPTDDIESRLISWGDCSILMSKDQLILKCGNNTLKLKTDGIEVQGGITATRVSTTQLSANNAEIPSLNAEKITSNSVEADSITSDGNISANGNITVNGNITASGTVKGSNIHT